MDEKVKSMIMSTQQPIEDVKSVTAILLTAEVVELKINQSLIAEKMTLSDMKARREALIINEDHLKSIEEWLQDMKKMKKLAEQTFKDIKKPILEQEDACDVGKGLFFKEFDVLLDPVRLKYDTMLADIDRKKQEKKKKEAQDQAVKQGIETTVDALAKKVATATTKQELLYVERLINLEQSPAKSVKYGEFHAVAIKKMDEVLRPVIKDQKVKLGKLKLLYGALEEAESDQEHEEVINLRASIGEVNKDIRQNQVSIEDQILSQDFFPVVEVEEVLPDVKTLRTDISFELVDIATVLKKHPEVLKIELIGKAVRPIAQKLKEDGKFEGIDEIEIDGIKYIITRKRKAL